NLSTRCINSHKLCTITSTEQAIVCQIQIQTMWTFHGDVKSSCNGGRILSVNHHDFHRLGEFEIEKIHFWISNCSTSAAHKRDAGYHFALSYNYNRESE